MRETISASLLDGDKLALTSRRGTVGAVLARAASIFASFALTLVVARTLGVEAAGAFFVVFTGVAVVATFGRFGTDNLALKLVGGASGDIPGDVRRLIEIAIVASIVGASLAAVLAVVFRAAPAGVGFWAVIGLATAVIPQALAVLAGSFLRAKGRLAVGTFAELGSLPALTSVGILVSFVLHANTLQTAIVCLVASSWLTALWSLLLTWQVLRVPVPVSESASTSASALLTRAEPMSVTTFFGRHSGPLAAMMGTSLIFYVLTWVPIFLLSATGSLEAVSFYTAAARLCGFVGLIPAIQVSYLAPAFARLFQAREMPALNKLCANSSVVAFSLATLPALVLIFFSRPVLEIAYGVEYEPAALALSLLTFGVLVSVWSGQVNQLMLLCDLERFALILNVALLAAWFAVGWWAAQQGGLTGVVIVSVTTTIVYQAAAIIRLHRAASILSFARIMREPKAIRKTPV